MKRKWMWALAAITLTSCSVKETPATYSVIPLPQEVTLQQAAPFRLDGKTVITYTAGNEMLRRDAEFLADYVREATGHQLTTREATDRDTNGCIALALDASVTNPEGYLLTTTPEGIRIVGSTPQGVFYGVQTLRKAIPATADGGVVTLPAGEVKDEPRFPYRGMHLDVCRHFFPLDFIKKYIDLLALHNMNTFHWHLTEDQGWRLEIKKYPRLTEVGAVRKRTVIGHNSGKYDDTPHGGFYTQEEAREIVAYAAERYIDVIPEIDLPGHMLAALAAYPSLGCTGGPYEVAQEWGVFDDVLCIGNDSVFTFLEDVLAEVMEIFPSKYIHIGGDEAPRTRWKKCPKCQALIRKQGIKGDKEHTAEDRLQSYCMTRIEKYLNEKGRQIIGWDEILEGDVAPNATVMSWRGSSGGIKAAQMGHDVIMTPNSYFYFDYYQSEDKQNEPDAIGGFLPVEKVYSCNPTEGLTPEQARFIKGAQANVWTEYIGTTDYVEYMILPRMAALAEVQWTQPERKDYNDFLQRLVRQIEMYERDGLTVAKHIYHLKADFTPDWEKKQITATLSALGNAPIYYTLDGTTPTPSSLRYEGPVAISQSAQFRAAALRPEGMTPIVQKDVVFSKSTFCPIRLTDGQPTPKFTYGGAPTLADGMFGNDLFTSGAWLGFLDDVTAVIDLGEPREFARITTHACVDIPSWIMGCTGLEVYVSNDDKQYRAVASQSFPADEDMQKKQVETYEVNFTPVTSRYVKVIVRRVPTLPKGHGGAGHPAFLFIDEIAVD